MTPPAPPVATASEAVPTRTPGRPRSAEAHRAILEATLEMLVERGILALTIEGVAARAGVGKATIYRRWPSKLPLVIETIETFLPELPLPDSGDTRADLTTTCAALAGFLAEPPLRQVLPHLAAARGDDPELDEAIVRFVAVRRAPLGAILRRGVERGELPGEFDVEALIDIVAGSIISRVLFTDLPADDAFVARCVHAGFAS